MKREKEIGKLEYYLWKLKDIEDAEKTEKYLEMKAKYDKRKISFSVAIKTKTDKLLEEVDIAITKIKVERIPLDKLKEETLDAKEDWYDYIACLRDCEMKIDKNHLDYKTLRRWELNYIRHNLTEYDNELFNYYGKVGVQDAYEKYHAAVMEKIFKVYPELKDENGGAYE